MAECTQNRFPLNNLTSVKYVYVECKVSPYRLKVTMTHRAPSFLRSPSTIASEARNLYNRDYQDDDNKVLEIEDDHDHPLSDQGGSPPRDQPGTSHGVQSVRRPPGPPVPQDSASPRAPEGIVTLKPANPFASF